VAFHLWSTQETALWRRHERSRGCLRVRSTGFRSEQPLSRDAARQVPTETDGPEWVASASLWSATRRAGVHRHGPLDDGDPRSVKPVQGLDSISSSAGVSLSLSPAPRDEPVPGLHPRWPGNPSPGRSSYPLNTCLSRSPECNRGVRSTSLGHRRPLLRRLVASTLTLSRTGLLFVCTVGPTRSRTPPIPSPDPARDSDESGSQCGGEYS
jgi:hypothetical protein